MVVFDGKVGNYFNGHVCNKILIYRFSINFIEQKTIRKLIQIKINQSNSPDQKPDYNYAFYLYIPGINANYL